MCTLARPATPVPVQAETNARAKEESAVKLSGAEEALRHVRTELSNALHTAAVHKRETEAALAHANEWRRRQEAALAEAADSQHELMRAQEVRTCSCAGVRLTFRAHRRTQRQFATQRCLSLTHLEIS